VKKQNKNNLAPETIALESKIFGRDGTLLIGALRFVLPRLNKGSVRDYPEPYITSLFSRSPEKFIYLYWCELLGRAYIAAAGSLIRHDQWIKGVLASYQANSYLGFCGALRGLLESGADSMYSLEHVAPTIADNWSALYPILRDGHGKKILLCPELEERLIHFAFARKAHKNEDIPIGHRALQNRDYIHTIRRFDPAIETLYCKLVEIIHPAKDSLFWTLKHEESVDHWRVSIGASDDSSKAISRLLDEHQECLTNLLKAALNYALVTLKLLRKVNVPDIDLSFMDGINADNIKMWRSIEAKLETNNAV